MSMLVRLKPYNPKRGHVMRKYTHVPSNRKFEESMGWYKVDDQLADYLAKNVRQNERDPESPEAFDVVAESVARQIDLKEKRQKDVRAAADAPVDLSTKNLRGQPVGPPAEEDTPVAERLRARGAKEKAAVEKADYEVKAKKAKRRAA